MQDVLTSFGLTAGNRVGRRDAPRYFKGRVTEVVDVDGGRVRVTDPKTTASLVVTMATADAVAVGDTIVVIKMNRGEVVGLRTDLSTMPTGWSDARKKCRPLLVSGG